jgi:hypothetical protein
MDLKIPWGLNTSNGNGEFSGSKIGNREWRIFNGKWRMEPDSNREENTNWNVINLKPQTSTSNHNKKPETKPTYPAVSNTR